MSHWIKNGNQTNALNYLESLVDNAEIYTNIGFSRLIPEFTEHITYPWIPNIQNDPPNLFMNKTFQARRFGFHMWFKIPELMEGEFELCRLRQAIPIFGGTRNPKKKFYQGVIDIEKKPTNIWPDDFLFQDMDIKDIVITVGVMPSILPGRKAAIVEVTCYYIIYHNELESADNRDDRPRNFTKNLVWRANLMQQHLPEAEASVWNNLTILCVDGSPTFTNDISLQGLELPYLKFNGIKCSYTLSPFLPAGQRAYQFSGFTHPTSVILFADAPPNMKLANIWISKFSPDYIQPQNQDPVRLAEEASPFLDSRFGGEHIDSAPLYLGVDGSRVNGQPANIAYMPFGCNYLTQTLPKNYAFSEFHKLDDRHNVGLEMSDLVAIRQVRSQKDVIKSTYSKIRGTIFP